MLMDEKTSCLSDLLVACREAADHYRMTAERAASDDALASLFRDHADDHERHADALADALREAGELPRVPDPEWEGLTELAHRLREAISADERATMLTECREAEDHLAQLLVSAGEQDWDDGNTQLLRMIGEDVAAHDAQLQAHQEEK